MLDKAISKDKDKEGVEFRKPYTGSKTFDKTCRNHGSCPWCMGNRKHKSIVAEKRTDEKLKIYFREEYEEGE